MGNFVSASPNEAIMISGLRGTRVKVGETGWRWWIVETTETLSLQLIQLEINSIKAETVQGVSIDVTAVATVKVKSGLARDERGKIRVDRETILVAGQQFAGKTATDIRDLLKACLEGHQRQILGTLTVEQVFKDRASFSAKVREHVTEDLSKMGFEVISYSIKAIADANGYMASLGATQTALVRREAAEGEARNSSEAKQKVSQAESTAQIMAAKASREAHVSTNQQLELQVEADQALELKRAETQLRVGEAKERAQAAIDLVKAQQHQEVVKQKTQQRFIEKEVETQIALEEARRMQAELEGQSIARLKMSENDAKGMVVKAQAEAKGMVIKAQAEADRNRLLAEAKADALRFEARAEADALTFKGKAEADALSFKGKAEAENMRLKAEAYNMFGQAALTQLLIDKLPAIAAEVSRPLAQTDKITFVSNGASDGSGGGGPSALTREITNILGQLPSSVQALTGFDLRDAISKAGKPDTKLVVHQEAVI
ncbi:hypothetical protein BASA81_001786 [Batrachochytrium salamandrivorans]|nr:hypothetical protein BASA81_001786 [Batrachochytrium salamandrivorans]